jgi:spore germination protein YaaH
MIALLAALSGASVGPHADFEADVVSGRISVPTHRPRSALPAVTPGPSITVYGYQAYWDADLYAVPWDDLSHIALFNAGVTSAGDLFDTSRWDDAALAVSLAQPYGTRVHLCVTNFDSAELEVLLGDITARQHLIDQLVVWQNDTGVHGINIDFEGLPSSRRAELVQFTADLEAAVGEVVLATPAVDWSGAWDYSGLTLYADLFIMGYGYHWGGSSQAGPTDPLYSGSGTVWSGSHSLQWTVDDYLYYGADPDRVILGLPLYGYSYPTASDTVPDTNLGSGSPIFMASAMAEAAILGERFEDTSRSPWYWDGYDQHWYPSVDSVLERIDYAMGTGIGGVGFWALHYDDNDPTLWQGIHDRTVVQDGTTGTGTTTGTGSSTGTTTGGVSGDLMADAGPTFSAFVGDTVVLSGEGSRGPDGVQLQYLWTQTFGPDVDMISPNSARPSFQVMEAGTHIFELVVSDGEDFSAPSEAILDAQASGCGCDSQGPMTWAWLPMGLLLWRRRR